MNPKKNQKIHPRVGQKGPFYFYILFLHVVVTSYLIEYFSFIFSLKFFSSFYDRRESTSQEKKRKVKVLTVIFVCFKFLGFEGG
jgi:hypothetical protein